MGWQDDKAQFRVYVSESGDFVSLGTRTEIPFNSGGPSGVPAGWTVYNSAGVDMAKVQFSVGLNRFNISNKSTSDYLAGVFVGAYRDFNIKADKQTFFSFKAQTMADKTAAYRNVNLLVPATGSSVFNALRVTESGWEDVVCWTPFQTSDTTARLVLQAYYTWDPSLGQTPQYNWGIQFSDLAMIEMDDTYPEPVWHEVTCDIKSLQCRYGRDRSTSRYDVASMALTIENTDGEFSYQGDSQPWPLRPGRFVKVEADVPANPSGMYRNLPFYYGVIDSLADGYSLDGKATASMTCVDISSLLSNVTVPTVSTSYAGNPEGNLYLSGARVRNVLTSVQWHPERTSVMAGQFLQQGIFSNGRTVRDELGLIADSEGGYFYADKSGRLVYKDRAWSESRITSVQAELLAQSDDIPLTVVDPVPDKPLGQKAIVCAAELTTAWSKDRIVNELSLANVNGSSNTWVDADSQQRYGPRTYQRLDFLNTNTHPEYLVTRKDDIMGDPNNPMTGNTQAVLRVNTVRFTPRKSSFQSYFFAAYGFLNDLVRVRYTNPINGWGYATVVHVQSIEHSISPTEWVVTLALDEPEWFILWSDLTPGGWDEGLWDVAHWDAASSQWSVQAQWSTPGSFWGK